MGKRRVLELGFEKRGEKEESDGSIEDGGVVLGLGWTWLSRYRNA